MSIDEADYSIDREEFENQYYQVEVKFSELLHPVVDPPLLRHTSHHIVACQDAVIILHGHMPVAHTLSYQSLHCQHSKLIHVTGYISETHLRN